MITTAEIIASKVAEQAGLLEARRNTLFENPDDVESNHKFRVSIRTLRSLLSFLSPWLKGAQHDKVQRDLKRVVKVTSRLRELDVLAQMAAGLDPAAPELAAFCAADAASERVAVLEALSSERNRERLDASIAALRDLAWKPSVQDSGLDPAVARNRFDDIASTLLADMGSLDVNDYEKVHDIRKRAKQVRYVAEQFSCVIGEDTVEVAKRMKESQDRLGALCDAKVNREIVGTYLLRPDLPDALARDLVRLI